MIGRIRRDCGLGLGRHCTYDLYLVPFSSAESDVKHQPTEQPVPFSSYLTLNNIVTLKSMLEVTQSH